MTKLIVEKIYPDAILPKRANLTDSGLDITFHNLKKVYRHVGGNGETLINNDADLKKQISYNMLELQYLERALIGTGIRVITEAGYDIQIRPRSEQALNQGLTLCNAIDTIDPNFRDELCVILINLSRKRQTIILGDKIAQLFVTPVTLCDVLEGKLDNNDRGGGFGSSGI